MMESKKPTLFISYCHRDGSMYADDLEEELQDYFNIGEEILCYRTEDELYDLVKYYLAHDQEREAIRKKGYMRFLNEHTYTKRWNDAIACIYKEKMLL